LEWPNIRDTEEGTVHRMDGWNYGTRSTEMEMIERLTESWTEADGACMELA